MAGKIKKTFSKFLSLAVCTGLVFTAVPVFAGESETPVNLFEENFESYSTTSVVNGASKSFVGNWSSGSNFGYDSNGHAKIITDPKNSGNKVMYLEGRSAYNNASPFMVNTGLNNLDLTKTYKLEFDFYRQPQILSGYAYNRSGGGIRFMAGSGGYYEIFWQGTNGWSDGTGKIAVSKSNPGTRLGTDAVSTKSGSYPTSACLPHSEWYHMTVVFANGEASWSAVNKSTGEEALNYSGAFLQPATIVKNTDGLITVTDNKLAGTGSVALQLMASGQGDSTGNEGVLFDNIVLNEYNCWTEGKEDDNVLYFNASDIMRANEGVHDILTASKIRRITSDTDSSFTMSVSENGESYTDVAVEIVDGKWICPLDTKTRYIKFSDETVADNIDIYCEVEGGESFDLSVGKGLGFILREKGKDVDEPHIVVSDTYRLSPADSAIKALRDGEVSASVYGTAVAKSFEINIMGELKDAELNGTESAYLAEKSPVIKAISDATDSETIAGILTGDISIIKDFDSIRFTNGELSNEQITEIATRLIDYTFETNTLDDVRNFINVLSNVTNLVAICNVDSTDKIQKLIEDYNDITYKLSVKNEYYIKNKADVHAEMLYQNFEDIEALQNYFNAAFVMIEFNNITNADKMSAFIRTCENEIGFDKEHFSSIMLKKMLGQKLIDEKSNILNIDDLKAFIDSYVEADLGIVFADDFDSYDLASIQAKGKFLTDKWKSSEDTSFGYDSNGQAHIITDPLNPDNKILSIEGRSEYKANAAPVMENTDLMSLDPSKTYKLDFDMYSNSPAGGGGIRFMVGGGNFYQIHWQGGNGWSNGTGRMTVSKNGAADGNRLGTDAVTTNSGNYPTSAFPTGKWYSISVVFANGEATWRVVDKVTGVENADFSGGFIQPAEIVKGADGKFTIDDKKLSENGEVGLKFMASGQGTQYVYFDNIVVSEYDCWADGVEADNILYYNASDVMREKDGVYDILNASKIRRITSDTVNSFVMSVSADGNVYKDINVTLNKGKWINTEKENIRYIRFADASVADKVDIFCEVEGGESFDVVVGKDLDFVLREKGKDVDYQKIAVSDDYKLSTDNKKVTGCWDGIVDVTVYGVGVAKSASVNIIGEMKNAEITGTTSAYMAEKAPIINAISNATDKQTIYDVMKSEGAIKLSDIADIDMSNITSLSDAELMHVANGLIDYEFATSDTEDMREFIQAISDEIKLLDVLNLTDNTTIENVIAANNDSYDLPVENRFYLDYKEDVLTAMQNQDFENIPAMQKYFADEYVMAAFEDALGYEKIGVIVEECKNEIGYDADKVDDLSKIDGAKTALYVALKENQKDLTTVEKIRDFIDDFEAPEEDEDETSSSDRYYGGGGGGGGGSSISMPATVITNNVANADNTVVGKKQLYPDVSVDHWAYDGIRYLSAIDAVSGYDDSTFKPNNQITRGEFVKILMVAFGIEIPTVGEEDALPFADITAEDWFTPYFVAANNAGIVLGDSGNANPGVLISRQEIAVMIDRVVKMQGKVLPKTNSLVRFDDDAEIASWAYGAISKMQIAGIINGNGSGSFLPKANATRAESAKMIYGAVQKAFVEPEPIEEPAQEETINE